MAVRYSGRTKVIFTRLPDLIETIYGIGPSTFITVEKPDGSIVNQTTIRLKKFYDDLDAVSASILKRLLQIKTLDFSDVYIVGNDIFISKKPEDQEYVVSYPYR